MPAIVGVSLGGGFGALGAQRVMGAVSRGAHSFPLRASLLGTAGGGWTLASSWWSPGGDGEQPSAGSFEAGGLDKQ